MFQYVLIVANLHERVSDGMKIGLAESSRLVIFVFRVIVVHLLFDCWFTAAKVIKYFRSRYFLW